MDIRAVLADSAEKLLDDELSMLAEELTTGGYDAAYRKECRDLIDAERKRRKEARSGVGVAAGSVAQVVPGGPARRLPHDVEKSVLVSPDVLSPYSQVEVPAKSPKETVAADLAVIRRSETRAKLFREYLKNSAIIDEAFLDSNISLFDAEELAIVVTQMSLSEAFLEKYLAALDLKKVATNQRFSEEFFMRHYADLDAELVLKRGINEWRNKDKRSKKLDMFLRLKGVHF